MAETLWKKKQHKNYQDEDKKSAINKNYFYEKSVWEALKKIKSKAYIKRVYNRYAPQIVGLDSFFNLFGYLLPKQSMENDSWVTG